MVMRNGKDSDHVVVHYVNHVVWESSHNNSASPIASLPASVRML